ncbi:MAG TPA: ribokinase [Chloroflexota bacterium]
MDAAMSERFNRVTVLGSLNMDLVVHAERLPAPGETVLGGHFEMDHGGKGANQAVAASRLGARVGMIGCVGGDDNGRRLLEGARADGVDVTHVAVAAGPSGVALIVVASDGGNQIAVAPGANALVDPALVERAAGTIRESDVLVAQLEIPLEAVKAAARIARDAGVPFLLNAAPSRPDLGGLLPLVSVLIVNETELAVLAGGVAGEGNEASLAETLLDRGPEAIVVTLGERGSLVVERRRTLRVSAYEVDAVDSTAAGDAFVGALAARYSGLDRLEEAARFASAAGALACTKSGAQPSLPRAGEVSSFVSRHR